MATRFIALSSVGNPEKTKYIYALSVTPVDKMRITDLIQKTTNETTCPFDSMNLGRIDNDRSGGSDQQGGQFFYDMNSFPGEDRRGKRGLGHEDRKQKRPRQTVVDQGGLLISAKERLQLTEWNLLIIPEKCWFCLSSPSVERHLVISIGDNFYLALAKGPIDKWHVLILSVTHIQSSAMLTEDDWIELEKFKSALKKFFESEWNCTSSKSSASCN